MAVSTKKVTRSRRGHRRSHDAIRNLFIAYCANCKKANRAHHICLECNFYAGKQVKADDAKEVATV